MPANENYTDYFTNSSEETFFLRPTTPDETKDVIKTLSVGKSLGPNSIPKKGGYIQCYSKKGGYVQCNNYRPISLTLNISKVTEK